MGGTPSLLKAKSLPKGAGAAGLICGRRRRALLGQPPHDPVDLPRHDPRDRDWCGITWGVEVARNLLVVEGPRPLLVVGGLRPDGPLRPLRVATPFPSIGNARHPLLLVHPEDHRRLP